MRVDILGVEFDNLTFDEAAEHAFELTERGGYIVTPNPEIILAARKDAQFSEHLRNSALTVADGIGVIYAAKIINKPLTAKITGIDLCEAVMKRLASIPDNRGVFLFGAQPGIAEQATKKLTEKYPTLKIVDIQSGYGYDENTVIERIKSLNPALTIVCLGMKRQEAFMAKAITLGVEQCLLMGLGGALDAFAGTVKRAPERWQKLNLEWLYRLIKQPSRIRRMIKLPLILFIALKVRIFGH